MSNYAKWAKEERKRRVGQPLTFTVSERPIRIRRELEVLLADAHEDEDKASGRYRQMAALASELGEHDIANELLKISRGEQEHYRTIDRLLVEMAQRRPRP